MKYTRRNAWELGSDWASDILWFARGVEEMQKRALNIVTGWRFYAAIHGFDQTLWQRLGYWSPADPMPSQADHDRFWLQCQHGSWYFLPWHRGYLLAFEANIRAVVNSLKGPIDWALPYWNYFKPGQSDLPPAFGSPDWPDGKGNNPLFVQQRYGPPQGGGRVFVPLKFVNLDVMTADDDFVGVANGGPLGFGGPDTGFEHAGGNHGGLEFQPHDQVHGFVGGGTRIKPGLMSDPRTAGLDPIFWLHHANIDRLWEVWLQNPPTHVNPNEQQWTDGPTSVGDKSFALPMPNGSIWDYTPGDVANLAKQNYTYDDFAPVGPAPQTVQRFVTLGATPNAAERFGDLIAVNSARKVELVGANSGNLRITGNEASTSVRLDPAVRQKVIASLAMDVEAPSPDRVFLDLENVRGLADTTILQVYVELPPGKDPSDNSEFRAGSVALFGVSGASLRDGEHAGQGLTFVLEITKIVDALHLRNSLDIESLNVRIVPLIPVPEDDQISIGRISIYRQGK